MRILGKSWLTATVCLWLAGCEAESGEAGGPRGSFEPAQDDGAETPSAAEEGEADAGETATPTTGAAEPAADAGEEVLGSAWPEPPAGYGLLQLATPSEEELPNHALAGYEVVAVYERPELEAKKVGFLRYGQRLRASDKKNTEGCVKGWYQLQGGGYACASKGLVVEKNPPFMKYAPPPPALDAAFPYEWAYVRKWNTPMWWRVPSANEVSVAKEKRAELEAVREGQGATEETTAPSPSPKPPPKPEDPAGDGGELGQLPSIDDDPKLADGDGGGEVAPTPPPAPPPESTTGADDSAGEPEPEPEPEVALPLNPQHPWLEKGFFISLAGKARDSGRSYWRTARGAFVEQSQTFKYEPKDYQGIALTREVALPIGFSNKKETKVYELGDDDKIKVVEKVERRTFFDFAEEVEHKGKAYMQTKEGRLVRKEDVKMPQLQDLPKGLEAWDRWIDVSLDQQMLVAYEGTRPVYVTLVSTGKKGSEEEPFETPTGRWRIYSKQVTSNMDGTTATDGNYAIQDVPWVMYFQGSYALHGAFWHRSFGRVRSHGCVNLGPSDARWLFFWSTPFLPEGWHGVHATEDSPGTTVVVHE
jgi:hypothetical protein